MVTWNNLDTLTSYLKNEYYALYPLYNFYFTRDAAVTSVSDFAKADAQRIRTEHHLEVPDRGHATTRSSRKTASGLGNASNGSERRSKHEFLHFFVLSFFALRFQQTVCPRSARLTLSYSRNQGTQALACNPSSIRRENYRINCARLSMGYLKIF